jgi:hypothetical protein
MSYNTEAIRKLLNSAFNDDDLAFFCFDHFRPVYDQFSSGMGRLAKIHLLIEYCDKQDEFDSLLTKVKEINPKQYDKFSCSIKDYAKTPKVEIGSEKSQARITITGDFTGFSPEQQSAAVRALAGVLDIPRDQINVLQVQRGSIILQAEMPMSDITKAFTWSIPIFAPDQPVADKDVKYLYLRKSTRKDANYFGVTIGDESMSGDGIHVGDIVLIRPEIRVENEDIVLISISTPEYPPDRPLTVIRRYYYIGRPGQEHWFLEASDPAGEHLVVMPEGTDTEKVTDFYVKAFENGKLSHLPKSLKDAEVTIIGKYIQL